MKKMIPVWLMAVLMSFGIQACYSSDKCGNEETPCGDDKTCEEGTECGEDKPDDGKVPSCEEGTVMCSADGKARMICENKTWRREACPSGFCYLSTSGYQCMAQDETVIARRCDASRRGIVMTTRTGEITRSCLEETGVDTACVEYAGGLVGCAMPKTCSAPFTENGTCLGNRLAFCDLTYIEEQPAMIDCAALGKVCASENGKADCHAPCKSDEDDAWRCSEDGTMRHCVEKDGIRVGITASGACKDATKAYVCHEGRLEETACASDYACIPSLGGCAKTCAKAEENKVACSEDGRMTQCQQTYEGNWAYVPVGTKECVENILYACSGGVVRETNCHDLAFHDQSSGELISEHGQCSSDYNYIPDFDVCTPLYEGTPCGKVPNEGACNANQLSYCNLVTNLLDHEDCSLDEKDTLCTVYKGYADCREPCKKEGEASCVVMEYAEDGSPMTLLHICVKDETNSSKLSWLEASAACVGDNLYTCQGLEVVKTDCTLDGGSCGVVSCEYPLCSVASSEDCVSEQRCRTDDSGRVVETVFCDA